MDDYSGHQATELDSHANMAVAGCDCTIIARSGCFANVTPFHKDLPAMEMVEIGDAMVAYDDPISQRTYLLVMRNALLIQSMDHNLISPVFDTGSRPSPRRNTEASARTSND
jgi:hypothetical protein